MSIESHFANRATFAGGLATQPSPGPEGHRPATVRHQARGAEADRGLIERLKAGDQDALEKIFKLYSAKLYNVALRILGGDASDAEEVIQDVFLTAFRKAQMFQGNSQFSTWLYRLTVNAALGRIAAAKKPSKWPMRNFCRNFKTTAIIRCAR